MEATEEGNPLHHNMTELNKLMSQQILINGEDGEYRAVYQIAYMAWRIRKGSANIRTENLTYSSQLKAIIFTSKPPLSEIVLQIFSDSYYDHYNEGSALELVEALVANPKIKKQIPDDWIDCGPVEVDIDGVRFVNTFPKSIENEWASNTPYDAKGSFNANQDGAFISTCGPNRTEGGISSFDNFLALIMKKKPWCIVALGKAGDYENYWLKDYESERFLVKVEKIPNTINGRRLVITDRSNSKQHRLDVVNIEVEDQTAIMFGPDGAKQFLYIWGKTDLKNPVLVHCVSGIGRTGQVKWLFGLLNELKENKRFATLIDDSFHRKLNNEEKQEIVNIAEQVLAGYRKTRFTMEAEPQLLATMPALFMLRAVQLNLAPSVIIQIQEFNPVTPVKFVTDLPLPEEPQLATQATKDDILPKGTAAKLSAENLFFHPELAEDEKEQPEEPEEPKEPPLDEGLLSSLDKLGH